MKFIGMIMASLLFLTGCDAETTERTSQYKFPKGMENCSVYVLNGDRATTLDVVYCPNAVTTTHWKEGKVDRSVTTIGE